MAGATTFNNEWNSTYSNLNNINQMISKCSEGGMNDNCSDILGMAQIMAAINWGVLTDLHGDIPFSECFQGISAPKVDSQESIYAAIFKLLDDAQVNLAKGGKNAGEQDIVYGGDTKKWAALGHAVKARYLLHTYGVNKSVLPEVVKEAQAAIDGGFEGFYVSGFNGVTADNAWSAYQWSRYYIASSKTVDDLMVARDDPREIYYNTAIGAEEIGKPTDPALLGVPGDKDQAVLVKKLNEPAWLENGAANLVIMSESEVYFILAEAQAMLGQDATEAFVAAVTSSLTEYLDISFGELTDEELAAYLLKIDPLFTANPLQEIRIQKYLAQSRGECIETYNDMRRIMFTDGKYPVEMKNPGNTTSLGNRWPLRLPGATAMWFPILSWPPLSVWQMRLVCTFLTENVWWAGGKR